MSFSCIFDENIPSMSPISGFISLFRFYQHLANKTIEVSSEEELFRVPAPESNSIAIIMKHMAGNMLSRWTDFLTSDGEKPWRKRDEEFEITDHQAESLKAYWEKGWSCLFHALENLKEEDLNKMIQIRGEAQEVREAIYRQLSHYAYHVGQIVFLGKMYKGEAWTSLSIPKGKSEEYNQTKLKEEKKSDHFTDEWLKK